MSLVHVETGEIVTTEPRSLAQVEQQCISVEQWAAGCDSIPEVQDGANRLAAIDEYLRRTSSDGRGRVAAAMRRLEVRIGELLEPARPRGSNQHAEGVIAITPSGLNKKQAIQFRRMAEHAAEVEAVIAAMAPKPASRRKVMQAISDPAPETPTKRDGTREAVRTRALRIADLAEKGYSSHQIAAEVGLGIERIKAIAAEYGFKVHADAVVGKIHQVDANRVVEETVYALEGLAMGVELINTADIDSAHIEEWANSLAVSLTVLTRLTKQLKEMTRAEN